MNPLLYFAGYYCLSLPPYASAEVLEICRQYDLSYARFQISPKGDITFCMLASKAKKLIKESEKRQIPLKVLQKEGIPYLFYRYRRRWGIFLGTAAAVFLLIFSQFFVWDIRVSGLEKMEYREVREELAACGLSLGAYIPSLDTVALENRVLISSDRISWISLYINGTVVSVQIIEAEQPPPEPSKRPANLIATADGVIDGLELYRGQAVVGIGQAVKKGDLLVSGIYDSATVGYRYTRASGQVLARTEHTYRIEIPFAYEEKIYSGQKCCEIVLNFFDFPIKIFKSTGKTDATCDIIKEDREIPCFGKYPLPVFFSIFYAKFYQTEIRTRSREEASALAYEQLDKEMEELTDRSQILKKEIKTTLTDEGIILECSVLCIENIALQQEFEVND